MNARFALMVRITFIVLDLLALNIIFFLMKWYIVRASIMPNGDEYTRFWVFSNISWFLCSWGYSFYMSDSGLKFEFFMKKTIKSYFLFVLFTLLYLYFSRQLVISRIFVSTFLCCFSLALLLNRMIYLLIWLHFRNKEYLVKRVLIIGYNDIGKKLAAYFERNNTQMRVVGFCDEYSNVKELSHYPIINTPLNAVKASKEFQITDIYSTILPEQDHRIYDLMNLADQSCIRFKLVPDFGLFVNRPMHLNYLSEMPVLSTRSEPLEDLVNRINKRIFDIVFSGLVIIFVLSWMVPLIALAIWLDSKGPIFFKQVRSGLNNKPFVCYKFRSMKINSESHTVQAIRNDKRFTRVGRFLRKTNLDEFPQFYNVLKGEMSITGPRPHMLKHTEDYSAIISKYMVRQFLKPGITGWAQVNGHRGETQKLEDMEARVDHDIWYMENWSLLLDVRIVALTAFNIFKGDKNAF
ncbi:MAG TPA: undecaprenyl-phosphate glucose phosphotransferase [Flavitalea sp.]|nr:undecaprenyl-phosphate glucose phosphotransferase [Flavitalea sp.]